MVFDENELHCDIFSLALFIQWIFVASCKLIDIPRILFLHPLSELM